MSRFLYDTFLLLYFVIARIISPFNPKAKKWVDGRSRVWEELEKVKAAKKRIWFHCSSLGEYEQALPLIEKFKGTSEIIITFFSPSGYEIAKKKNPDGNIFYLPHDSKANARKFIERIQPDLAVFVRYDLWYYYLKELQHHQIQTLLISAVFRKDNIFFQWYGGLFSEMLRCFNHIFVQDEDSNEILLKHGFRNVTKAGDTRIDRVAIITASAKKFPLIEKFKGVKKIFIVGSLEPKDESIVLPLIIDSSISKELKFIIAPHHVGKAYVNNLAQRIKGKVAIFSETTLNGVSQSDILIIDEIGMLSSLYRYADIVFIGGGFGEGLHNTLEPAAWGKPILFGPKHQKFIEAVELVKRKGAFIVNNAEELRGYIQHMLSDQKYVKKSGEAAYDFIQEQKGGTEVIFNWITQNTQLEK